MECALADYRSGSELAGRWRADGMLCRGRGRERRKCRSCHGEFGVPLHVYLHASTSMYKNQSLGLQWSSLESQNLKQSQALSSPKP